MQRSWCVRVHLYAYIAGAQVRLVYIYMYICTKHEPEAETSDTHISEEEGRLNAAYPSETHHVTTSQDILL